MERDSGTAQGGKLGRNGDWLSEELNILEALRLLGCTAMPNERSSIEALISDRHKRLAEVLKKAKV